MTEQTALVPETEDERADLDFEAGMAMEATRAPPTPLTQPNPVEIAAVVETPVIEAKPEPVAPAPKYVRITQAQLDELSAAAKKTATHEQQFSKAFGSIGDVQKLMRELQANTPRGGKVSIPKDAFADLARDFPELAEHTRTGLEKALANLTGTGPAGADPATIERLVTERVTAREIAREIDALEDAYPDWKKIVGAVDISKEAPDPNNAFRKWLGTKDKGYQARINGSTSAAILSRAISTFQTETKAKPAAGGDMAAQLRAARIRDAVQPRGDGGQPGRRASDDDEFLAGFQTR